MTMDDESVTPDLDELQQTAEPTILPPLNVVMKEPATVHSLPSRHAVSRNYIINTSSAQQILSRDLRRKRAIISAFSDGADLFYIGDREGVGSGNAAMWPTTDVALANGYAPPLVIEHTDQVFAMALSDNITISIIAEYWAD